MKVSALITAVEKLGARFSISNREVSIWWPPDLPPGKRKRQVVLNRLIQESAYLVTAYLLERKFSQEWERDHLCHCSQERYAHLPHRVGDIREVLILEKGDRPPVASKGMPELPRRRHSRRRGPRLCGIENCPQPAQSCGFCSQHQPSFDFAPTSAPD